MPAVVRKPAPEFEADALMPDGSFKTLRLKDFKGKYLVLFFYPLDFTFVCPTEIVAFSDRVKEFKDIGCEVVAASVDSKFSHLAWTQLPRNKGGLGKMDIPILADLNKDVARAYDALVNIEGDGDNGVTYRALYIIDDKGVLRHITINDLPVGRNVDEYLRLVKAFQFTDKHGEVCPANWKPGLKSLKADPTGKLEYFEAVNK